MEPLSFFIGFRYFIYLKKKQGDVIPAGNRTWILLGVIFGALLGSRIIGGIEAQAFRDPEFKAGESRVV